MHGREKEAEASISEIESDVAATKGEIPPVDPDKELEIRRPSRSATWRCCGCCSRTPEPVGARRGAFNAATQTLAWSIVFFFASAGASAGYLTVSEIFPLEVRPRPSPCSSRSRSASARWAHTCTVT